MDTTNYEGMVSKWVRTLLVVFLGAASLFLLVRTVRSMNETGGPNDMRPQINVTGTGEYLAVPDIALVTYSVIEKGDSPQAAQTKATDRTNKVLHYLRDAKIADKDIKTTSYTINPQYEYQQSVCKAGICPPGKQILTGYEVSQSVQVKIRDTKKAGEILAGIGEFGVQSISGLELTFDDEQKVVAEARKKAIEDAQAKAKVLANDLGVRLVRITSFTESGGVPPMYYSKLDTMSGRGVANQAAPAPDIPTGENKVTSNVTITYEIR
jgi:uncharacterized protein YggE